uniref:Costars domain-containing protein n=2 Tax=Stomoxys calcitrans TaxID=35570 RepID=A0A1I8Q0U3_STOCA
MADLSHELGALRFVVDSPLSSKVAMFNNQVSAHKQSQLLNPFAQTDGRSSPKPSFSKDEYGKPLAGSLTEMRGQKANIHVLKEMLELCQIIDSEGYNVKDEPEMRVIPFGELFNIYNYISDKVVGILLRARKHKLVEFEGEMLFQRRDDDVPIFLLKPIAEIRREMNDKIESIKRCGSPAPQATSVLLDKKAHGLDVPKGGTPRASVSRTPTPQSSKASSPARDPNKTGSTPQSSKAPSPARDASKTGSTPHSTKAPSPAPVASNGAPKPETPKIQISRDPEQVNEPPQEDSNNASTEPIKAEEIANTPAAPEQVPKQSEVPETQSEATTPQIQEPKVEEKPTEDQPAATTVTETVAVTEAGVAAVTITEDKNDLNNNPAESSVMPVVVIEASAVYVRSNNNEAASPDTATTETEATPVNEPAAATESAPVA